ncbi:MAG: hypothetical protein ACLVAT_05435 [Lachnospiraceae bacterium]
MRSTDSIYGKYAPIILSNLIEVLVSLCDVVAPAVAFATGGAHVKVH